MIAGGKDPASYGSRAYAKSLAEFGAVIHLPRCDGFLLKRNIPGTSAYDAMGSYPLFFCQDWAAVSADLAACAEELVSVSLVADPFGDYTPEILESTFDVVNPFKQHYLVDLTTPLDTIGSRHHRREARKARNKIEVKVCSVPAEFSPAWNTLYAALSRRHAIHGIRAFSQRAFEQQLSMPGMVVHQAWFEGKLIGAQLFYMQDDVVHCHLGAVEPLGYAIGAFYALDQFSFEYFSSRARVLDLGGGTGEGSAAGEDGLSRYKYGWSSHQQPVFFCGKILQPDRYQTLSHTKENYFPTYRQGEFH